MATVSDPAAEPGKPAQGELWGRLETARAELIRVSQIGALRHDPVRDVLVSIGEIVTLQLDAGREAQAQLGGAVLRIEQGVDAAIDRARRVIQAEHKVASDKLAAIVAGGEGRDRQASARIMAEIALASRQALARMGVTIGARSIILSGCVAVALGVVATAGGYAVGLNDGIARQMQSATKLETEAAASGPSGMADWAQLMHDNDVRASMAACIKAAAPVNGRKACLLPVWLDPPAPPPHA